MLGNYALYADKEGVYNPVYFYGNHLHIFDETTCDYSMSVQSDKTTVFARVNQIDFNGLKIHCVRCDARLVRQHSSFNNAKTQIFQCVFCNLKA